ncbi:sigma-54-dependent Fis family transcriptional regulator [Methanospirillum sp.]|uniref:sigma-54 dependent transcriptional regulator n=1 Tax=Methanospirillum sp. TaxID=45200 RepID=UPI002631DAC8|nr:sigma-54-dependent Fis family transcriptional regulator [Methanospirillum sp.]
MKPEILVIDDDESVCSAFKVILNSEGFQVSIAKDFKTAFDLIDTKSFHAIFSDIFLDRFSGIDILKEIKRRGLRSPVIMITGEPNIDNAADSLRIGAFDYLPKPIHKDTLIRVTKHAIQHKALLDERALIENELDEYRSHLEAIFMSVKEAIISVDPYMNILHYNDAFTETCSFTPAYKFGQNPMELVRNCNLKCWTTLQNSLTTGASINEYRIECDHAQRPQQIVMLNISPLKDRKENRIGSVMTIRDITRILHLEKELMGRRQSGSIVGKSKKIQGIFNLIEHLKDIETTVLITGPSGTGKELVAREIYQSGARADKPFVAVNCSALSDNLLESELFGHVKGAFTGAVADKTGRFQLANHGTIFLDEIGDISPRIQLKLLRVLETKEFERVGDSATIKMDARIITATNKDLREKVSLGEFREDLYYRLKVVEIHMPSLKERRDDIPLLVDHYISFFNNLFNKHITGIAQEVEHIFMEYDWPGNIRELLHVLEHAFVLCEESVIRVDNLPHEFKVHPIAQPYRNSTIVIKKSKLNKDDILNALEKNGWNKVKTAQALGISRPNLYQKMKNYNIVTG